jgi:dolichyl-phosphate beta-glucosyltransferase
MVSSPGVVVERPTSRRLAGKLFVLLAKWTLTPPVRDTQCGFKMFQGDVARGIAAAATEDGYLFDLEWLALAQRRGLRVAEVGINWKEMPGSKLSMTKDAFKMLGALRRLRRRLKVQA